MPSDDGVLGPAELRSTRVTRHVNAPRANVYRALLRQRGRLAGGAREARGACRE